MKIQSHCWVVFAVVLCLGACNKKQEVKAPVAPEEVQEVVEKPVLETPSIPAPAAKTTAMSVAERAAMLGFVKYLPQDTEVVMALHQGAKSGARVKSSKFWKFVQMQMGMGIEPVEEASPDAAEPVGPAALFGSEFTIALGRTAGAQGANLLTAYRRMGYFQMRMLAKAFAAAAKAGDFSSMAQVISEQYGPELLKNLLADPESGVALLERMKMPPLYLAFRSSSEHRVTASQQIAALIENLGQLEEGGEPVEVEKAGQKFLGQKVSGAKLAKSMEESRDEMEEILEPATLDRLLEAISKMNLVAVSGTLGDYVILFIGSSVDDLNIAADPGQSLVASDALAFCDAYASKELAAVIYGRKDATDKLIAAAGGLSDMANGLRDGLAGAEGLGDTRDLEALLRMVGERETALRKLAGNDALGVAAFFDEGFKIESYGGTDNGAIDWNASNKLAPLGDADDVVMFANMTTDAAYDAKARAYLEALFETVYAMTMKVSEVKMADDQMTGFQQMAKMFDTRFRKDAVAFWDVLSGDFHGGLGRERALIVDLNGSVPAIPGIPQAVVDEGKFPRISWIAPVTDRTKLAASWEKMNTCASGILAVISEMNGKEIPMQKPISSEKGGFTTWFISMPFFNDDFLPSVTVGDQWFAASTSKNQAIDLVNKAAKGGTTRSGLWFSMNFKTLQKFSRETLRVVDKNAAAIFGADGLPPEKLKMAGDFINVMDEMDKLTVHTRREGGVLRTSLHFKTR